VSVLNEKSIRCEYKKKISQQNRSVYVYIVWISSVLLFCRKNNVCLYLTVMLQNEDSVYPVYSGTIHKISAMCFWACSKSSLDYCQKYECEAYTWSNVCLKTWHKYDSDAVLLYIVFTWWGVWWGNDICRTMCQIFSPTLKKTSARLLWRGHRSSHPLTKDFKAEMDFIC